MVEYKDLFKDIKSQISNSRNKAIFTINKELILLYWNIGRIIIRSQQEEGWGSKFIQRLSKDLKVEFPDIRGFSERNLKYMKKLAEEYEDIEFVQQVVAQIAWPHNVVIMDRMKNLEERVWYIIKPLKMDGLEMY
jgi:predicted nuclease of restriction endonuclease-like (RecB) superfamily